MRYSYYDPYIWLEAKQKYAGICNKMRNQVEIRNEFQSLQYQSHKRAQKPVQGHKLHMVIIFCFPHSTKYPWLQGGGCPIPENTDCQAGWGPELPDLVEGVPALCGTVGLDELYMSLPTQTMLWLSFAPPFYPPRPQPVLSTAPRVAAGMFRQGNKFTAPPQCQGSEAGAQHHCFAGTSDVRGKRSEPTKATQQTQHLYLQTMICHLIVFFQEACLPRGRGGLYWSRLLISVKLRGLCYS